MEERFDLAEASRAGLAVNRGTRGLFLAAGILCLVGGIALAAVRPSRPSFTPPEALTVGSVTAVFGLYLVFVMVAYWSYPIELRIGGRRLVLVYSSRRRFDQSWDSPGLKFEVFDLRPAGEQGSIPIAARIKANFPFGRGVYLTPPAYDALVGAARGQGLSVQSVPDPATQKFGVTRLRVSGKRG